MLSTSMQDMYNMYHPTMSKLYMMSPPSIGVLAARCMACWRAAPARLPGPSCTPNSKGPKYAAV